MQTDSHLAESKFLIWISYTYCSVLIVVLKVFI